MPASPDSIELSLITNPKAFGDGAHPSTKGALAALDALSPLHGITRILDIGCGSGILSLKAAYQWHVPVIASDLSPESVALCAQNAAQNQLDPLITAVHAKGCQHSLIQSHAPYELILCNILAEELVHLAPQINACMPSEGVLILSGMLVWQRDRVMEAYALHHIRPLQTLTIDQWVTLIMQKD